MNGDDPGDDEDFDEVDVKFKTGCCCSSAGDVDDNTS
jgi:hypothetical protein